jgi:hypothetical protein
MMPALRAVATVALMMALIPVTGALPANAAPSEEGVEIKTIPAVEGFQITLGDETVPTDESGVAQFRTRDRQNLTERVKVKNQKLKLEGRKVRVEPSNRYLKAAEPTVAMDVFWRVGFSFVDPQRAPVDVGRIEYVQLRSSTGELLEIPANQNVWLQGSRVVTLNGGPQYKEIQWSIEAVKYASSNVVNSAQQRFEPADTGEVEVVLLFYRTNVTVKDAFFGFPSGDAVLVTSPDGRVDRFPLAENGTVNLPSLQRGEYSIVVEGPGPRMARPVAISRNQVLDLKFYSWLDVGLVGGLLAAFAIGVLLVGWWRRRAHESVVDDEVQADLDDEVQADPDNESAPTIQLPINGASAASASWTHPPWESTAAAWPPSAGGARRRMSTPESQ